MNEVQPKLPLKRVHSTLARGEWVKLTQPRGEGDRRDRVPYPVPHQNERYSISGRSPSSALDKTPPPTWAWVATGDRDGKSRGRAKSWCCTRKGVIVTCMAVKHKEAKNKRGCKRGAENSTDKTLQHNLTTAYVVRRRELNPKGSAHTTRIRKQRQKAEITKAQTHITRVCYKVMPGLN